MKTLLNPTTICSLAIMKSVIILIEFARITVIRTPIIPKGTKITNKIPSGVLDVSKVTIPYEINWGLKPAQIELRILFMKEIGINIEAIIRTPKSESSDVET